MDMSPLKENRYLVKLSEDFVDLNEGMKFVSSAKCGAINSFLGTVRDLEGAQLISALYYEAYEPMARKQIQAILEETLEDDSVEATCSKVYVAVRLGEVPVGQASIYICVSSRGRHWSHRATIGILEKIKSSVVIWKKAIFEDGQSRWINESKSEAWWLK